MNGKWSSETWGSWTAISRAPYLKAIGLWGKGDCWQGGGLFASPREYWINGGNCHFPIQIPAGLRQLQECPFPGGVGAECLSVYYPRLLRDGWKLAGETDRRRVSELRDVFEKAASAG